MPNTFNTSQHEQAQRQVRSSVSQQRGRATALLLVSAVLALAAVMLGGCRNDGESRLLGNDVSADDVAVQYFELVLSGDREAAQLYLWPGFEQHVGLDPSERSSATTVTASNPVPVAPDTSKRVIDSLTLVEKKALGGYPAHVVEVNVGLGIPESAAAPGLGGRKVILARSGTDEPWRIIAFSDAVMPLHLALPDK